MGLQANLVAGLGVGVPSITVTRDWSNEAVEKRVLVLKRGGHLGKENLVPNHAPNRAAALGIAAKERL